MPESKNPAPPKTDPPAAAPAGLLVIDTRELFGGRREVWIEHEGVRYRLRITRRNKLILQK
jgi:hemin uptake protein HemP